MLNYVLSSIKYFLPLFDPWWRACKKRYPALHVCATENSTSLGTRLGFLLVSGLRLGLGQSFSAC